MISSIVLHCVSCYFIFLVLKCNQSPQRNLTSSFFPPHLLSLPILRVPHFLFLVLHLHSSMACYKHPAHHTVRPATCSPWMFRSLCNVSTTELRRIRTTCIAMLLLPLFRRATLVTTFSTTPRPHWIPLHLDLRFQLPE